MKAHWNGKALLGPDVGIRFNYRIGRFIKSYLPAGIPWHDSYYYLQAQGYWVLANWRLFFRTGEERYRQLALSASEHMVERQRDDGAWDYPNPEWSGRIATAEGTWASIGLLESYRHSGNHKFLTSALRWHRFLLDEVGFEQIGDELSVNYFSNVPTSRVPNNSAFVLRFLSELASLAGDNALLQPCQGLVTFIKRAQRQTGEIPYMAPGSVSGVKCWEHFQCYQYNAFQCLDLMRHYEITGDPAVRPVASRCLNFLRSGVAPDGHIYFDCHDSYREVPYHTAAVGAAFATAERLGLCSPERLPQRAFSYLLRIQNPAGAFPGSLRDYHFLSDRRPYPRSLVMILFHFLVWLEGSPS